MRRILALFVTLLIIGLSCKQAPENILSDIKKKYADINAKQKDLKPKQVDNIITAGTGAITGYYKGEEVRKVVSEHYTDSNRKFTECYFDDGMLIFIIEQNYIYNKPVTYTEEKARANNDSVWYDDKKTRLEISRYYFHKNKLIKWQDPENDIPEKSTEFINKESELWAETVILLKQLKED